MLCVGLMPNLRSPEQVLGLIVFMGYAIVAHTLFGHQFEGTAPIFLSVCLSIYLSIYLYIYPPFPAHHFEGTAPFLYYSQA